MMVEFDPGYIRQRDLKICQFPKYKGIPWTEVIQRDYQYVEFIVDEIEDLDSDVYDYLMELLEEFVDEL